jgi:hypothetical protein
MRISLTKANTARQAVAVRAQANKGEASAPAINRRELALRSVNLLALAAMFTWGATPTPSTIGACDTHLPVSQFLSLSVFQSLCQPLTPVPPATPVPHQVCPITASSRASDSVRSLPIAFLLPRRQTT